MARRSIIIMVTCASRKEAGKIIDVLLQKRLVACANIIGGIRSKFWWMGKLDTANEILLACKTVTRNFNAVSREIKNIHSYKVPEIIALPIVDGYKPYIEWIENSVKPKVKSTKR